MFRLKSLSKRIIVGLLLFVVLFSAAAAAAPSQVQAASSTKITNLKENKTYKLDLNGGKKETVKIAVPKSANKINVYVNGKRVCTLKDTYNTAPYVHCRITCIKYLDVQTSDKYKEILIGYSGFNADTYLVLVRYYNASKTKVYKAQGVGMPLESGYNYVKNTGSNKIFLPAGTPFSNENFGQNWVIMPSKLSGNKIVPANATTYKVVNLFNNTYHLKKAMKLYANSSRKNAVATLKAGTTFEPKSIKPFKKHIKTTYFSNGQISGQYTYYDLFVKVKTSTGKTGWLYFPAFRTGSFRDGNSDYLVNAPGWN